MTEWQPIDTAPSDGKKVIVYRGNSSPDEPNVLDAIKADGEWWRRNRDLRNVPTHWQPLPNPPKAATP